MNRTHRIYTWLLEQDGPRTSREIASMLGEEPENIYSLLNNAVRKGRVRKVGTRHYVAGNPPLSREESQQRLREAFLAKRNGGETARQRRDREAAERKAAKAAQKKQPRPAKVKPVPLTSVKKPVAVKLAVRETIKAQSVEEWIAQGGRVQTLQPFEVSAASRFKRIQPRIAA